MYKLDMPDSMDLALEWMDEDYTEEAILNARVWDVRRVVLELYGWASYHLYRDPQDWCERCWDDGFVELVKKLHILDVPRRGCIINPVLTPSAEVVTLVRHNVPVHYEWKSRLSGLVQGGWLPPSAEALRFDPYAFGNTHDYAAFLQAGGEYNNTAMDRSILGHKSANELCEQYFSSKRTILYDLPRPPPKKGSSGKRKARYFVREYVGGRLTEISKNAMSTLIDEEAGELYTEKRPTGDMQLMTKSDFSLPCPGLDLVKFFNDLDSATLAKAAMGEGVTDQLVDSSVTACQPAVGINNDEYQHRSQPSSELSSQVTSEHQSGHSAMDVETASQNVEMDNMQDHHPLQSTELPLQVTSKNQSGEPVMHAEAGFQNTSDGSHNVCVFKFFTFDAASYLAVHSPCSSLYSIRVSLSLQYPTRSYRLRQ
jgi:hypothetical protein